MLPHHFDEVFYSRRELINYRELDKYCAGQSTTF